jgi:hypothetical protein
MPSAAYDLFREAVLGRKQVTCMYQGRYREVCPHVIGYKAGQEKVLTFQFGGQSSSGLPPGGEWRCLFLAQVRDAQLRDGEWHTGHSHLRPQTCVDNVDAEVDY